MVRLKDNEVMTEALNAEVIAIGTEILLGELTDTNSVYIARVLRDLGINLYFMTSVGDNELRIASSIEIALSRAHLVITCGGLGPTVDDMTRQAVARATRRGLTFHQPLLDQIAARFASFQAKMTENNRRQAYLPDDAIVVENPVGTAPAFIVEHESKYVISLPGVPREMKFLMQEKVIPFLRQRFPLGIIKARTLKTAGIGESALDEMIGDALLNGNNPTIGLAAHSGQIDVRITAKAPSEDEANAMIAVVEAELRERIGEYVYGVNDDRLEQVLAAFLQLNQARVAVAEAGIADGGLVKTLESIDPALLAHSYTFDDPDALRAWLGAPVHAPLNELARLAGEALLRQGDDHPAAAAMVIVSRPDVDESADSQEGTAIVVMAGGRTRQRTYGFGAMSELARNWARTWALSATWQMLKEALNER
jgi:nicotinamide-nucleotide amidase